MTVLFWSIFTILDQFEYNIALGANKLSGAKDVLCWAGGGLVAGGRPCAERNGGGRSNHVLCLLTGTASPSSVLIFTGVEK